MLDAPRMGEPKMTEPLPSHATMYVAHAVANDALVKLAMSLAVNMALVGPMERAVSGREILADTLTGFAVAMDCRPGPIAETLPELGAYDADMAESLAMEIVGEAIELIRVRVLD